MSKAENPHEWYLRYAGSKQAQLGPRGSMLTVSQALDYLNDGMNFLYCRPDDNYLQTVAAKDTFTVSATSGEIDEDDLIILMDEIAEFAGDSYYADSRTDKEPQMFDINLVSAGSSLVAFEAIFLHQAGEKLPTTDAYPYSDSWVYGQWGSDASNLCSQEGANADAVDLFRRDLRENVVYRNKFESYYLKDPYTVCFTAHYNDCFSEEIPILNYFPLDASYDGDEMDNPNDPTEDDNLYDRLLFYNYSGNQGYHTCLSSNEMNFHYEFMEDFAEDLIPNPPGNDVIAQVEVGYSLLASGTSTIFHEMVVARATKTEITDSQFEDAIPLP